MLRLRLLWLGLMVATTTVFAAPTLPPRTIDDVIVQLRAAKFDGKELTRARELLAVPIPTDKDQKELAAVHYARAKAAERLGLTDSYIAEYRAAWTAAKAFGGEIDVALYVDYVGAEVMAGNVAASMDALEYYSTRFGGWGSHSVLADYKARFGDLEAARGHLARVESGIGSSMSSRDAGWWRRYWLGQQERARAAVTAASGKFAEAEAHYRNAADYFEEDLPVNQQRLDRKMVTNGQEVAISRVLFVRKAQADMMAAQGRLLDAEILYRDNLKRALQEFGSNSAFTYGHSSGLATILLEQNRLTEVEKYSRAIIEIFEKQGVPPESYTVTTARQSLAGAYVLQSRWAEAMKEYDALRAVFAKDSELQRRLGQGNEDWGLTLVRTKRVAEGVAMLEKLVASAKGRFGADDQSLAQTRAFLGLALAAAGKPQEALAEFRASLPRLLGGASDAGEEGGTARRHRLVIVLEAYLDLLHNLQKSGAAPAGFDLVGEAFRAADVARGSSVQKALAASAARSAIRDPRHAALARDEQDLGHRIATLKDTLSRLQSATAEQRLTKIIADLQRDIPQFQKQRLDLRAQIVRDFPDYAQLIDPKPVAPAEAQKLLQADEALAAFYVGEQRTYLWAMRPSGAPVFAAAEVGRKAIGERVTHLRRALDPGNSASMSDQDFDLAAAHDLYAKLLQPLAAGLAGAKSLLVVPHGALGQLPFSLLPTRPAKLAPTKLAFAGYREVPWLLREMAVTQLPSVSTLAALRRATVADVGERSPFLGFGDPFFSSRQAGPDSTQRVTLASRGFRVRNGPGERSASSATIADLARLPDTAEEVREIAKVLKANPDTDIRLGKAASETEVKMANLAKQRVIVFATHGLIPGDLNGLTQPALALSNPEVTGEKDADGLLTMEEVLGLKLNADWVVLSACNTAAGDGAAAEAVSGLGRAFFYAGTRALLVTNWPVETVSARLITTELFRRQAEQPTLSRAEALRQAMLAVMNQDARDEKTQQPDYAYAHPLFWAPYALVGDGGR